MAAGYFKVLTVKFHLKSRTIFKTLKMCIALLFKTISCSTHKHQNLWSSYAIVSHFSLFMCNYCLYNVCNYYTSS